MGKASIKVSANPTTNVASATLTVPYEDVKLKATCSEKTFSNGVSLTGVSVGVEKPGSFSFDYDITTEAPKFQFEAVTSALRKPVKLKYIHPRKTNATTVEATAILDPHNKLTYKYSLATGKPALKYAVAAGSAVLEPGYDFNTSSWSFAALQRVTDADSIKASYEQKGNLLTLDWVNTPMSGDPFKVSATVVAGRSNTKPKVMLEKTWTLTW